MTKGFLCKHQVLEFRISVDQHPKNKMFLLCNASMDKFIVNVQFQCNLLVQCYVIRRKSSSRANFMVKTDNQDFKTWCCVYIERFLSPKAQQVYSRKAQTLIQVSHWHSISRCESVPNFPWRLFPRGLMSYNSTSSINFLFQPKPVYATYRNKLAPARSAKRLELCTYLASIPLYLRCTFLQYKRCPSSLEARTYYQRKRHYHPL